MNFQSNQPIKYLLIAMYSAGLIGLNITQTTELFKFLTPFNLIVSVGILLYFHQGWDKNVIIFCIITFLTGFFIEVIGVKTGKIFGIYEYQTTLGFKIFEVPPIIGLNWLMLVYCVGNLTVNKKEMKALPYWGRVGMGCFLGALFLTLFDFIAEPVAIKLEMWHWFGQTPPLQNYIGWLAVSLVLLLFFHFLKIKKNNPIALLLLVLQICFFLIQRILLAFF